MRGRSGGGVFVAVAAPLLLLVLASAESARGGSADADDGEVARLRERVQQLEAQLEATEQESCASDASVGGSLASMFGFGGDPTPQKIVGNRPYGWTGGNQHAPAVDVGQHKHAATKDLVEKLDPSLARDPQKYLDLARGLMRTQDFAGGVHALKLATHYGCRADIWVHLAKALRSLAGKTFQDMVAAGQPAQEVGAPTALPAKYIYEAVACVEVAAQMSTAMRTEAMELRAGLLGMVQGTCGASNCERYAREKEAVQLMLDSKFMNATNVLCLDEAAVSIPITAAEREEGRIDDMETMRSIWTTFNACGAVSGDSFSWLLCLNRSRLCRSCAC
jgi:hypothetical protein